MVTINGDKGRTCSSRCAHKILNACPHTYGDIQKWGRVIILIRSFYGIGAAIGYCSENIILGYHDKSYYITLHMY